MKGGGRGWSNRWSGRGTRFRLDDGWLLGRNGNGGCLFRLRVDRMRRDLVEGLNHLFANAHSEVSDVLASKANSGDWRKNWQKSSSVKPYPKNCMGAYP